MLVFFVFFFKHAKSNLVFRSQKIYVTNLRFWQPSLPYMFHGQLDCLGFFRLWLSTPLAWSFPRLTWALSTCNQQEGFLNPEQSAIPCQLVMCLPAVTGQLTCITVVVDFSSCNLILPVYRGCHFHNLDLPGVNFLSSALGISGCLPCLLACSPACHCIPDNLAAQLPLNTSTDLPSSEPCKYEEKTHQQTPFCYQLLTSWQKMLLHLLADPSSFLCSSLPLSPLWSCP